MDLEVQAGTREVSAKSRSIVREIERLIEPTKSDTWLGRKALLMAMSLAEVQKIAHEIRGCTPKEAMALIESFIEDFEQH